MTNDNIIPEGSSSKNVETADRFNNRVQMYIKYRPDYPEAIVSLLREKYNLNKDSEIADIGAGVGHSIRLLLPVGCYIYGIEPSQAMFDELVKLQKHHNNLAVRLQTAENTNLESKSVDFIVCGQSYHWFDKRKSKTEFSRILKPQGVVVLIWNTWDKSSDFSQEYIKIIEKHSIDYNKVSRTGEDKEEKIKYLYSQGLYSINKYHHSVYFDIEGLKGRYMSSSYGFLPGMEGFDAAMVALEALFNKYQKNNKIEFSYTCKVYHGRLNN